MPDSNLSRREWLERLSVPAIGVSVGAALSPSPAAAVPSQTQPPSDALNGARVYNVRDHGAKGDGTTLDTTAVQAAIDACHRDGGGTVLVPAGTFHIGTVELKSNVTLHLAAAATLLGSADGKQYHAVDAIPLRGDSTLGDGNWALIFAVDAKNVTIDGPGLIDGQGFQFHAPKAGVPPPSGLGGNQRPYHLLFYRCEHLRVQHVRLVQSASTTTTTGFIS
jgi:polygalacturonase